MTIGDKIKKIRTFRNMTQAELGAALGWGDKGANRLAQYETNYRVPRKDLVTEMAKILDVNPLTLHEPTTMDASELMEILFWIDEFNPGMINLFQLETYPGEKSNSSDDAAIRYHDSDSWKERWRLQSRRWRKTGEVPYNTLCRRNQWNNDSGIRRFRTFSTFSSCRDLAVFTTGERKSLTKNIAASDFV